MLGTETECRRLGEVERNAETVLPGLKDIRRIGGSGVNFTRLMAALHPLPLGTPWISIITCYM